MSIYNGIEWLPETLRSVLDQRDCDLEFVVVDDGSTDGSSALLDDWAASDARVRVIHQANTGLTRALIRGCDEARGEFIARQDCGDLSSPGRFTIQAGMLRASAEVLFVSCATAYVGPGLEALWTQAPTGAALEPAFVLDLSRPGVFTDGPTHHGSVMMRRDAYERVGGYRAAFRYGQDYDLWFRLAEQGRFQLSSRELYTARVTPGSISTTARVPQMAFARLSRAALEARQRGESDAALVESAAAIPRVSHPASRRSRADGLYFIGEVLRRNRDARALTYLRSAVRTWPFLVRAWLRLFQAQLTRGAELTDSSRRAYDTWHRALGAQEGTSGAPDAIWHRMVLRRVGDVRGLSVAEIGCGRGDFAIHLARLGARVTAVDLSPEAISIARRRAIEAGVQVDFRVADAQENGLPPASFDLVISCECLEHVPQPPRMAAELRRICKTDGRCLVTTPSYLNGMLIAWGWSLMRRRPINTGAGVQPIENFFLYWIVGRMLKKAGFRVVDFQSRIFVFGLLPRVNPARLRVNEFRSRTLNRLFRPFGLHFLYDMKPE
jgi:2-polyprenyl-3-methyl-5-hydroxy-6-metoxy-1,4-benzoquinol methylase